MIDTLNFAHNVTFDGLALAASVDYIWLAGLRSGTLGASEFAGPIAVVTDITDDTPLRLSIAAQLAFPGGGMTASGLRREAQRGRLVIERIAGKDYTTMAHIRRMRDLCRVNHPLPASTSDVPEVIAMQAGSSLIAAGKSAQERAKQTSERLRRRSPPTSEQRQGPPKAPVIPLK
jgi:hypothetical protein